MEIPEKRASLELSYIQLYSIGFKKVYTNHFYTSMNKNFGIEMRIRNNTNTMKIVKVGGCVRDDKGNPVHNFNPRNIEINPRTSREYSLFVKEHEFKVMNGNYVFQVWLNDKPVKQENFTVTYK